MTDENSADQPSRDLLGDPVDQNRESWGRPKFEKTKEKQETVTVLAAAGWTRERIARHLGCDVKTLRNHFSQELDQAADAAEAEALLTIYRRMQDGNVSAARQVRDMAEKGRAVPPAPKPEPARTLMQPEEKAPEKLGKKETQIQAAKHPPKGWGQLLN